MKKLLIKSGRVIDPSRDYDQEADLLISGVLIEEVGKGLKAPAGTETIDAEGLIVAPGLIDMHVGRSRRRLYRCCGYGQYQSRG